MFRGKFPPGQARQSAETGKDKAVLPVANTLTYGWYELTKVEVGPLFGQSVASHKVTKSMSTLYIDDAVMRVMPCARPLSACDCVADLWSIGVVMATFREIRGGHYAPKPCCEVGCLGSYNESSTYLEVLVLHSRRSLNIAFEERATGGQPGLTDILPNAHRAFRRSCLVPSFKHVIMLGCASADLQ